MASITEPREPTIVIHHEEPVAKSPPMLTIGPLAWIRTNLFSSWTDTLLTLGAFTLIISVITSFFSWVVGQANWMAVTLNLRQFIIWRYPADQEWRLQLLFLFIAFVIGFALSAWARVPRWIVIATVILLAFLLIVPALVQATISLPPSYFTAGEVEIVSGSSTTLPQPQLAFIAKGGETITVSLAEDYGASDAELANLYSFTDVASNLLLNAAANRLSNEVRIAELNTQLAGTLTAGQRARLEAELGRLEVPPVVVETYALNQFPTTVRILRGSTGEVLGETTLTSGADTLSLALPADGWYVLEKSVDGEGNSLLRINGLYPLTERSFTRSGEEVVEGETVSTSGRIDQYSRMTDRFITEEARPVDAEGKEIPMATIIDNQYRGTHSFSDYLRVYLSPFLNLINIPFTLAFIAVVVGFFAARYSDQFLSPSYRPRKASNRGATWLLIATPIIMFVLIYGFGGPLPLTDTRLWGGLMLTVLLTVIGIIGSFPLGILLALGRRSKLPIVSGFCTLYIEFVRGVPLITVLFTAVLLLPYVNPAFAEIADVFTVMVGIVLFSAAYLAENVRGGLQSIPPGQEEAAKALGLANWQIILFITLPQALRAVIPALVGQCISLFKDTSLVAIVGLADVVGAARSIVSQTEFIGSRRETFMFITLIYFVVSYVIASISRRIEASGAGAARRI